MISIPNPDFNVNIPGFDFHLRNFCYSFPPPSFLEYIQSGLELSLIFGIDFTGSNNGGIPEATAPDSLHYVGSPKLNNYEEAISEVGRIVEHYSGDYFFPAYGYGAEILATRNFPDKFAVNFRDEDPIVNGIDGLLMAYRACVPKLGMGDMGTAIRPDGQAYYGDDFYQLILQAIEDSKKSGFFFKYHILILVIDGSLFDDQATIDAIVEAQDYPISIVIVGIGPDDFSQCRRFDADQERLTHSNGTRQTRDVVQFFEYKYYKLNTKLLASKVLEEIPKQFNQYMESVRNRRL